MNSSSITIERKRADCSALPKGWQREESLRKSGISTGKVEVIYYSPAGKKIETKPQLARQLGDAFDISNFDFQTGKMIQYLPPPPSISLYRCSAGASVVACGTNSGGSVAAVNSVNASAAASAANTLKRKYKTQSSGAAAVNTFSASFSCSGSAATSTGSAAAVAANLRQQLELSRSLHTDVSLVPPIRQTASIFKQPVTVVRNHENTKVKHDPKHGGQEKPQQLFWEKRLERLRACHASGEEFDDIGLPRSIRAIGPNVDEQTVLQSLATALHVLNGTPVMGQTSTKTEFNKNAAAFINPEQPLMQAVLVSEDDIRRQEDRVSVARKKLQDALKA